jgi:hypothetical protein
MSVYSDTNLYFITSNEIGMENRLPSRAGELLLKQGLELDNDNPFRASQMPSRLSRLGVEIAKVEGEGNPFQTPTTSPVGSPKFMIGEGKLRPGMGVQRTLTPNTEEDYEVEG